MNTDDKGIIKWTNHNYKILQLIPAGNCEAVYALSSDDNPEVFELSSHPIHLLALAEETLVHYEKHAGQRGGTVVGEEPATTEIVGIEFSDGMWDIVNEADNFAGLTFGNESIGDVTGYLKRSKYPLKDQAAE